MKSLFIRTLLAGFALVSFAHADDKVTTASAPARVQASAPANSAAAPVIPSKDEVSKAIAVLESAFLGQEAPAAAQTILQYVQYSKDVAMELSPQTTPWVFGESKSTDATENNFRYMLLVAYMAGNAKSQLAAGKTSDNPHAGWQAALKAYEAVKKKNAKIKISELEKLKAQQTKGQLPSLAQKALQH